MLAQSKKELQATFGEGYWADHWSYGLDLIEDYLRIWPENRNRLMENRVRWYRPQARILPRAERYTCIENDELRQYRFLKETPGKQWMTYPDGSMMESTVLEKLVCLCVLKFATLDPWGCGIEMEGGRPGWYDALNGLPALLGSSVTDAIELLRHMRFTMRELESCGETVCIQQEYKKLMDELSLLVEDITPAQRQSDEALSTFWDKSKNALEACREAVYEERMPEEVCCHAREVAAQFELLAGFLEQRLSLCRRADGMMPTYFCYHARKTEDGITFTQVDLPLFLEAIVRDIRILPSTAERKKLHGALLRSTLYDEKLKMLRVNEVLKIENLELGRAAVFTPGWLENASIWLHMEYKYILELLRGELYREFSCALRQMGIPFLDAETYARSTLENCSFLVSSLNPEKKLHGRGFVARLSGSTAEFMQIWQLMLFGARPFAQTENGTELRLQPCIPKYLIGEDRTMEATFLGKSRVIYHFAECRDYFPGEYQIKIRNEANADSLRSGEVLQIEAFLS